MTTEGSWTGVPCNAFPPMQLERTAAAARSEITPILAPFRAHPKDRDRRGGASLKAPCRDPLRGPQAKQDSLRLASLEIPHDSHKSAWGSVRKTVSIAPHSQAAVSTRPARTSATTSPGWMLASSSARRTNPSRPLVCQSAGTASTEHSTKKNTSDREPSPPYGDEDAVPKTEVQGLVAVETEKLPVLPTWLSACRVVQTRKPGLESVGSVLPGPGKVLTSRNLNPERVQDVSLRARPEAQSHPARAVKASKDQAMPIRCTPGGDLAPRKDLGAGPGCLTLEEGHPKKQRLP